MGSSASKKSDKMSSKPIYKRKQRKVAFTTREKQYEKVLSYYIRKNKVKNWVIELYDIIIDHLGKPLCCAPPPPPPPKPHNHNKKKKKKTKK